ncbi:MAG: ZIP family metal transporter [Pseudonocardia sp.]|nr:ZIP family metal transporter [Pseudonocardia sp.]
MSTTKLLILAAIAGSTIALGLPLGRLRSPMPRVRAALNATALGILVFLLFDVLAHANEPVEQALVDAQSGDASWWRFAGLAAVFAAGVTIGAISLVRYDTWMADRLRSRPDTSRSQVANLSDPERLAFFIAFGIGLHNFSEGLAIGQSAASGEVSLATVLIVGFALHNATEGFGIVAPFASSNERPTWAFLATMAAIGGGPTFVGTLVGRSFVNDTLFLAFLALAAGSILYVIVQLLKVGQRIGYPDILMWGLVGGLALGFATDYVLVAGGA